MQHVVSIEIIGLGDRGLTNLRLILQLANELPIHIESLRDSDEARIAAAKELCRKAGMLVGTDNCQERNGGNVHGNESQTTATSSSNNSEFVDCPIVQLTLICTDWQSHAALAIDAMRRGRHVAVEVPAALTLDEIRALVQTSKQTDRQCFMLENCCYDPALLDAIHRIRGGEIGEPVHAEGTYYHRLGDRWTPWRLEMNRRQRGDLYPTHELAPLCMALGISPVPSIPTPITPLSHSPLSHSPLSHSPLSHGSVLGGFPAEATDHLSTLVCMDTAPFSGPATYEHHLGHPAPDFLNGDHTTTLIRTRRGRTILLRHDVLTDIPYERLFRVVGTHGTITVCDDGSQPHDHISLAMHKALISALAEGRPLDFTVEDLALWCAVTPLSTLSIQQGFAPVAFPQANLNNNLLH